MSRKMVVLRKTEVSERLDDGSGELRLIVLPTTPHHDFYTRLDVKKSLKLWLVLPLRVIRPYSKSAFQLFASSRSS
jgi:hypothetical protein